MVLVSFPVLVLVKFRHVTLLPLLLLASGTFVVGIWHFCCCCCWYWHLALLLLLLASGTFAGLILQVPGLWLEGIEEGAHLLTSPEIENKIRVWDIKELGIMDNKQKIMDEGK